MERPWEDQTTSTTTLFKFHYVQMELSAIININ